MSARDDMLEEELDPVQPISEAHWVRILGGRQFRILVKPEQEEWAGRRAVRCAGCTHAGDTAGGDPWRAWCLEHRCMVSNTFPKLCRQYVPEGGAAPIITSIEASAERAEPVRGAERTDDPAQAAGVRDTSRAAYRSLQASGHLTRQQQAILDVINCGKQLDWTRQELARESGYGINVITGRVNELLALGRITEPNKRRCSVTGERVYFIQAVNSTAAQAA